jgi:hypothetical protein
MSMHFYFIYRKRGRRDDTREYFKLNLNLYSYSLGHQNLEIAV